MFNIYNYDYNFHFNKGVNYKIQSLIFLTFNWKINYDSTH